jgi:hypothetical protein
MSVRYCVGTGPGYLDKWIVELEMIDDKTAQLIAI